MDGFPYVMYYSKCSILIYLIKTSDLSGDNLT